MANAANTSTFLCELLRHAMTLAATPSSSHQEDEITRQSFAEIEKCYGEIGIVLGKIAPLIAAAPDDPEQIA